MGADALVMWPRAGMDESVPPRAIRCAITTVPEYEQHGLQVAGQLSRIRGSNICAYLAGPEEPDGGPDVCLWIVGKANSAEAQSKLNELRSMHALLPILAVTVDLDATTISRILANGVSDFTALPLDCQECAARIHLANDRAARLRAADVRKVLAPATREIVGMSPTFMRQLSSLPTIAGCNAGVLILGETGTGKEVFAEAIHYLSSRASKPWVAVNCAGIPTELIESELFGHVRGAFTNASQARSGLVREAEGGTLFLDEVDSLPYGSQGKLLRFLQDRTYRPVGSSQQVLADVRVIAASNGNLTKLVAERRFRQDLFFRLNVLSMTLPALRERREDIVALAAHFVAKACECAKRPPLAISPALLSQWMTYDWPGNVRELRHAVKRAVLFTAAGASCIQPIEESPRLPEKRVPDSSFRSAKARIINHFERNYLEMVLQSCDGNITRAAGIARKNRRAFFELLRKHQIEAGRFRNPHASNADSGS
jgi:two-component system, NtrC family, response regulator GlrR